MPLAADSTFEIQGQTVNLRSIQHAVSCIITRLSDNASFYVFTLNLDHLVKLKQSPPFREAYRRAEFVTADGFPIVKLAAMNGTSIERTTGSDLIEPLCKTAATSNLPIFLLGTTPPTLRRAADRLKQRIPDLDVRGLFAPPLGFNLDSLDYRAAIEQIKQSGARICFVALGAPLQELFSAAAANDLDSVAFICVGAGLDFIAGTQVRCPSYLRQMHLEWAWRLATNPARLGGRYYRCALLFARLIISAAFANSRYAQRIAAQVPVRSQTIPFEPSSAVEPTNGA